MALVRVGYKRTFQTRPYETQVIELGIEQEGSPVVKSALEGMRQLYSQLESVGDQLMKDALAKPDPAGRK